jgi:hypothetical protein
MGVILNNVKPEAGPEYFKYHSQHYYGPESESRLRKRRLKTWLEKIGLLITKGRLVKFYVLTFALALLVLGIYWQDLHHFASDWLATLQQLVFQP